MRGRACRDRGVGRDAVCAWWPASDPRTAALLNGIAGRAIELCEGLRLVSGQAAAQVLPAVLAMAEAQHRSGEDLLTAFILGYDAAARLCHAFTPWPLAHQNGQACLLAAAAAGARLRGLDAAGVSLAMRIAASLVLTPSYTNVVAGATALNVRGRHERASPACWRRSWRAAGFTRPGRRDRGGAVAACRRRLRGRMVCTDGLGTRLAHHAQLFPALCLLQSDPSGAGCTGGGAAADPGQARPRSTGSISRRIASPPSCAIPIRRTSLPRNTRCRMPPP